MAVLFSAVTLTVGKNQVEFLAAGIPRAADDLEGWAAFEDFMDELDAEQEVGVHVEAYLYGEGETVRATPEEVAYFTMRADADEEFLHDHCDNMRNGQTIIEHREADIIRYIFDEYIKGASLKTLAEELTARRVPYTEKTEVWDKARIARIIDNAKYTGSETYDPIVDEDTFEEAAAAKEARQRNQIVSECEGIALMRDRIRCGQCGAPMARRICSKRKVKESWTCSNDICGCRVRISDTDLLVKVTLILNRIIENADLMAPKPKMGFKESLAVQRLQNEIDNEFTEEQPSEQLIVSRICEIASQLYKETNAREQITARIAQKRVMLMNPQTEFNSAYFTDLVESVILEAPARVSLLTKTAVQISEGEPDHGSQENTEEDSNTD